MFSIMTAAQTVAQNLTITEQFMADPIGWILAGGVLYLFAPIMGFIILASIVALIIGMMYGVAWILDCCNAAMK